MDYVAGDYMSLAKLASQHSGQTGFAISQQTSLSSWIFSPQSPQLFIASPPLSLSVEQGFGFQG
jgi:hypothetical protein